MAKTLNMLTLLICIGLLAMMTGCAATQKHESSGQYVDDSLATVKEKIVSPQANESPALLVFPISADGQEGV
jgi:hypothetical protein